MGKYGAQVQALLKKTAGLDIGIIAPLHGPVLTENLGYYINLYRYFQIMDAPDFRVKVLCDWYEKRGFGYGVTGRIKSEESKTEFRVYNIYDEDPLETLDYSKYRLEIPKKRYDFKLSHLTHITPRLDFRGQMEFISDLDFLDDYFTARYKDNIQPPTYAALEYQADRASFSVLATARVNDFDSVVERLPEVRMDIFRQELFGGLYYQSENSAGYLYNRWRSFDARSRYGKLENYGSARLDSLHMFYYPLMLDVLNIIPRAGFRLTGYSETSRNKITDEDLNTMFGANSLEAGLKRALPFKNFDTRNGDKLRLMGEFGVEINTKIYRTWQNVRSAWMGIDGLRHVIVPYINYTYIPDPSFDTDKILYFDDIDRLQQQNFVRFGLTNRLQTRKGDYGSAFSKY